MIYLKLKDMLPVSAKDTRSIHFIPFPDVKAQYFEHDIERRVSRMQQVIELGRVIRDKKNLSLKTPLRELIVINPAKQYRDDITSLESYICEELNIRTLSVTDAEEKFGVLYKLAPDHKGLGQKYKKDYPKMRKALMGTLTRLGIIQRI